MARFALMSHILDPGSAPPAGSATPSTDAALSHLDRSIAEILPPGRFDVVANPLPFDRTEPVVGTDPPQIADVPAVGFIATEPGGSFQDPELARRELLEAAPAEGSVKNRYYEVRFDPETGSIETIRARNNGFLVYRRSEPDTLSVRVTHPPRADFDAGP